MGYSYKILCFCLVLAGISLTGFSEEFHLKNGQVIKARLMREDQKNYYIELSFGLMTLDKNNVKQVKKEQISLSPSEQFDELCKKTSSEKECLEAAEWGVKNNLHIPAILFLKRSLIRWNPNSEEIKNKISVIEKLYADEVFAKVKIFHEAGNFRKAALAYEEAVNLYPSLTGFREFQAYRDSFSSFLMTEDESLEKIRFYINSFPSYSSEVSQPPPFPSSTQVQKNPFESFSSEEKKLQPRFSPLVLRIEELLQHLDYIQKHKMHQEVHKPLHTRKELDASRSDPKKFNSFCAENNRIYKAKAVLRDYAQKLSALKAENQHTVKQLEKEALEWKSKGYEKISGLWLKGDELKQAKGLELYKGKWLDPKDPDYAAQKAELDRPAEPALPALPSKEIPAPSAPPVVEAVPEPVPVPAEYSLDGETPSPDQKMHEEVKNVITTSREEILSLRTAVILVSILLVLWYFFRKTR